jgi:hypothetical protein
LSTGEPKRFGEDWDSELENVGLDFALGFGEDSMGDSKRGFSDRPKIFRLRLRVRFGDSLFRGFGGSIGSSMGIDTNSDDDSIRSYFVVCVCVCVEERKRNENEENTNSVMLLLLLWLCLKDAPKRIFHEKLPMPPFAIHLLRTWVALLRFFLQHHIRRSSPTAVVFEFQMKENSPRRPKKKPTSPVVRHKIGNFVRRHRFFFFSFVFSFFFFSFLSHGDADSNDTQQLGEELGRGAFGTVNSSFCFRRIFFFFLVFFSHPSHHNSFFQVFRALDMKTGSTIALKSIKVKKKEQKERIQVETSSNAQKPNKD